MTDESDEPNFHALYIIFYSEIRLILQANIYL